MEATINRISNFKIKFSQVDMTMMLNNSPEIRQILSSNFVYSYEKWGFIFVDRFAICLLVSNGTICLDDRPEEFEFIEEQKISKEYRVYRHYTAKGYFLMSDQTFGSMFAVYKEVR